MRAGIFGPVFVTAVERVIRAGDESFAPFDQRGSKKSGDHANDYLLQKRRVHGVLGADAMPPQESTTYDINFRLAPNAVIPSVSEGPQECSMCFREVPRSRSG
jgi:hypothetical protein